MGTTQAGVDVSVAALGVYARGGGVHRELLPRFLREYLAANYATHLSQVAYQSSTHNLTMWPVHLSAATMVQRAASGHPPVYERC